MIQSEYIKGRRSFGRISLVAFPLLAALMAIILMGGQLTQIGAYNWWYMLFLPTVVALVSINLINVDKRMGFFNVNVLPLTRKDAWLAKLLVGCSYLLVANAIVFGLTTISGLLFGSQYPIWRGLIGGAVLTLTCLWQIPLGMFLVARFNSIFTFLSLVGLNIFFSSQDIAGGQLWYVPFAISARLMTPIIGINPNGTALSPESPLQDNSVILPGILISLGLLVIGVIVTTKWFVKKEEAGNEL